MGIKASIVIGLGFGDEGKGLCTDFLCRNAENSVVVRFNGGQQAGHNVVLEDGKAHVFSNFGAGTLRGIPTYWSQYCTFSPAYFWHEYDTLICQPKFYLDKLSPVTTHYDVLYNRALETSRGKNKHGSCGAGYGATVERHRNLTFFAFELFDVGLAIEKLKSIKEYYRSKVNADTCFDFNDFDHETEDLLFLNHVENIKILIEKNIVSLTEENNFFYSQKWQHFIFEGAQGILLDQNFGFQPYITKSNTTSKNALEIIGRNFDEKEIDLEIYYVTRAYHTRHGAGPFIKAAESVQLINNQTETNFFNNYQGAFQVSYLDIDLVNYAISCDVHYSKGVAKNLLITCIDHIADGKVGVIEDCELRFESYDKLYTLLRTNLKNCYYSFGNTAETIKIDTNFNA